MNSDDHVSRFKLVKTGKSYAEAETTGITKATITRVGFIVDGTPEGWTFEISGNIPAMAIDSNGRILWAGYTVEELREISERFYFN